MLFNFRIHYFLQYSHSYLPSFLSPYLVTFHFRLCLRRSLELYCTIKSILNLDLLDVDCNLIDLFAKNLIVMPSISVEVFK